MFSRNFKCLQTQKLLHMLSTNMSSFLQLPINKKNKRKRETLTQVSREDLCSCTSSARSTSSSAGNGKPTTGPSLSRYFPFNWSQKRLSFLYLLYDYEWIIKISSHVSKKRGKPKKWCWNVRDLNITIMLIATSIEAVIQSRLKVPVQPKWVHCDYSGTWFNHRLRPHLVHC